MTRDIVALAAGVVFIVAVIPYLIDIVRRKSKPNIVSWFSWTLLLSIATAAAFSAHESRTAYLTLGDAIATGLVAVLGIKYGLAKFSKFDIYCQIGALLGLALWFIFDSPTLAIVFSLGIDLVASIPTFRHAWLDAGEETLITYLLSAGAGILTLLSLESFTVASMAFPIYLSLSNSLIAGILRIRINGK